MPTQFNKRLQVYESSLESKEGPLGRLATTEHCLKTLLADFDSLITGKSSGKEATLKIEKSLENCRKCTEDLIREIAIEKDGSSSLNKAF